MCFLERLMMDGPWLAGGTLKIVTTIVRRLKIMADFYTYDEQVEISGLINDMAGICQSFKNLDFKISKDATCVNGNNSNDGSFIWTDKNNTLLENLNIVNLWMNEQINGNL